MITHTAYGRGTCGVWRARHGSESVVLEDNSVSVFPLLVDSVSREYDTRDLGLT